MEGLIFQILPLMITVEVEHTCVEQERMWDTFYGHRAYIQITFVKCQEVAENLTK